MRLIDVDDPKLFDKCYCPQDWSGTQNYSLMIEWDDIKTAPIVDAKPVIRCNMCKYYETDTGFCYYHDHGMYWDGFCSCGAKMGGDENETD